MQRELYRSRTDPKHQSKNPRRRTKHTAAKAPAKTLKRDGTYINIEQEMKHGRGPRK